jgi:hypothetical protein
MAKPRQQKAKTGKQGINCNKIWGGFGYLVYLGGDWMENLDIYPARNM